MTMYPMRPSEIRANISDLLPLKLVPFVQSSPGLGKSAIIHQLADHFKLELVDIRLSQCAPEDLMGLPMRIGEGKQARSAFIPFNTFPIEGDKIPPGKKGWLIFLDEFNSAPKLVEAAAYKLVHDKMVGQAKLHPNAFIVCAGNLVTDKAIVNSTGTAMQSRVVHFEMQADHDDFIDYARKADFDYRVIGFLEFQPSKMHQFDPNHQDRTFACPRTWEFVSRYIKNRKNADINLPTLAGMVSDGVATEFYTFLREYEKLPKYVDIATDPQKTIVPDASATQYALVTMIVHNFQENDFKNIVAYVDRLPAEFRVIFYRFLREHNEEITDHPYWANAVDSIVDFLSAA